MSFRFEPVKWLTWIVAILVALAGSNQLLDLLPRDVAGWITTGAAIGVVILGYVVRGKVTALAAPRDDAGRALVPVSYPGGGAAAQEMRTEQDRARRYGTAPK